MPENMNYQRNSSNNTSKDTTPDVFGELGVAFDPENIELPHWNQSSSKKVIFSFSKKQCTNRSGDPRSS